LEKIGTATGRAEIDVGADTRVVVDVAEASHLPKPRRPTRRSSAMVGMSMSAKVAWSPLDRVPSFVTRAGTAIGNRGQHTTVERGEVPTLGSEEQRA
jgi:hypothetical protein